ncbi:endolytic transglycosylase MltG [Alkalicoccobacillus plakortidis]|uniref:Endolytic murein transglycosylase n=1 Tax=Alkalicoccobacillus plakortidis TaxID=444060 RepID=A0ABT0XKY7_9BACI|nr:endolytic transglycosylase MltG [Alkalicoccobacillus plakortidis]MCM2676568.1 endolytic transglycosylase MltG [Alkalicoccobacillus plakortidis]
MSDSNEKPRNTLYEDRVSQAKIVRKWVFISLIAIIIIGAIIAVSGYAYLKGSIEPVDQENGEEVEITVPIGSTPGGIGEILENAGLIANGTIFKYYVRYLNESNFQAGDYTLSTEMSMEDIIHALKDGKVMQEPVFSFTIPEGYWLEDIVAKIAEVTDYSEDEIMEKMQDREYIESLMEKFPLLGNQVLNDEVRYPLEGYLFPARYDFTDENTSIETIIETMLARTESVLDKYTEQIGNSNYTLHELMTLASIIEREAQKPEDRYLISGVLYNRLDQDMKLQVDPTVAYAAGSHLYMTSFDDLEVDSPYNTYMYEGIPIGPIASPGEDSIKAALEPRVTDYVFFYARVTGEVIYNSSYEDHQEVVEEYRQEWIDAGEEAED